MSKSEPKAVIAGFDRRKEYSVKVTAVRGTERSKALLGRYSGQSLLFRVSSHTLGSVFESIVLKQICSERSAALLFLIFLCVSVRISVRLGGE